MHELQLKQHLFQTIIGFDRADFDQCHANELAMAARSARIFGLELGDREDLPGEDEVRIGDL